MIIEVIEKQNTVELASLDIGTLFYHPTTNQYYIKADRANGAREQMVVNIKSGGCRGLEHTARVVVVLAKVIITHE